MLINLCNAQMHDIVRDFTLASQANSGLEKLQRSFVSTLVADVSSKPSGNAAQATISTYASSTLAHHLRGTLSPPFAEDDLALKLLFHEIESVVAQALASVDRSDVETLATGLEADGSHWSATRLWYALSTAVAGLSKNERMTYLWNAVSAFDHVNTRTQPGALMLKVRASYRFIMAYSDHEEVGRLAQILVEVAELDTKDVARSDQKAVIGARQYVGLMLLGWQKLHFSLTVSVAQAKRGAIMLMDSMTTKYMRTRASMPEGMKVVGLL